MKSKTMRLTKREIISDLEGMGIDYDPREPKRVLAPVRDAGRAARDAQRQSA